VIITGFGRDRNIEMTIAIDDPRQDHSFQIQKEHRIWPMTAALTLSPQYYESQVTPVAEIG
jgi:hypothetical protein